MCGIEPDRCGAAVDACCFMQAWSSSAMRRFMMPFLQQVDWYICSRWLQGTQCCPCMQAEAKAMAERKGKGMNLSIKQLNAVLRL